MTSLETTPDSEQAVTIDGDPRLSEARAVFFAHRFDELKKYAKGLTYSHNVPLSRLDPEDIAMEAITLTMERWFDVTNHRAYAYEIVRNLVRRAIRDDSQFEAAVTTNRFGSDADMSDPLDEVIDAEVFRLLLKELPHQQRAAVFLRFYEDMTSKEISPLLGCKPATVDVHMSAGIRALSARAKKAILAATAAIIVLVGSIGGRVSLSPSQASSGPPTPDPDPTPLPSGGLNPVGWDVPSSGGALSWAMIILGGLLVLLGIAATALILMRREDDGDEGYED